MFTTSYKGLEDILMLIVRALEPKSVVELGTQQGHSAVLIAKGTKSKIYTYDTFEKKYPISPFNETHADYKEAIKNTKKYKNIKVRKGDAFQVHKRHKKVDLLHVDVCNYYDNVHEILLNWHKRVKKAIILEGGGYNKWQKKKGFDPFYPVLEEEFLKKFDHYIMEGEPGYALTILIRK